MPYVERFLKCCLLAILLIAGESPISALGDETGTPENGGSQSSVVKGKPDAKANGQSKPAAEKKGKVNEKAVRDLLAGKLDSNWTHFSSKEDVPLDAVWSIIEQNDGRLLQCVGDPRGFLLTKDTFSNFQLSFEWKFIDDAAGNSGVLIFTKNEPRLWPTSMQIQLHQPRTGAVFPTGDAKSDNSTEPPPNGLAKEVGEWNVCQIVSTDGRVRVTINDRSLGEVTGCQPASGHIAIQSEGSKTQFRNIRILEIPDAVSASEKLSDSTAPPPGEASESTPPNDPAPPSDPKPKTP